MTVETLDAVVQTIRHAEGFRAKPYTDTVGVLTIGFGRALGRIGISEEEGELLLQHDIARSLKDLDFGLPWWRTLDEARQGALVELCFQLGLGGLLDFHKMRDALRTGDFGRAADELLDSKFAQQVPARAARLAAVLRGEAA